METEMTNMRMIDKATQAQEIKITGRSFEKHLMSQLSWWSFMQVSLATSPPLP